MSSVAKQKLSNTSGISCHAWNGPHSQIAICPYTQQVDIYEFDGTQFHKRHTLDEHEQLVSGIDWASERNLIVTCAHDRNAYVWQKNGDKWEPQMTLLPAHMNRAALCVKWSPSESKFAIGSGSKSVAVCYYEEENNWWITKVIRKKHNSSVTCLAWHSNNWMLATGSSDYKCRIFCAAIKNVDAGAKGKFGELLMEVDIGKNWIHGLSWSPSCKCLAICSHDSCVHFVDVDGVPSVSTKPATQTSKLRQLPQCACVFLSDDALVSVGFHDKPLLFTRQSDGRWHLDGEVKTGGKGSKALGSASSGGPSSLANNMFKAQDAGNRRPSPGHCAPSRARMQVTLLAEKGGSPHKRVAVSGMDPNLEIYQL